ncbi:NAD(P)/FAD-dependent oxidoreductase [Paenibacillus sp. S-38]|uniref:NAD(P)/FAD-dependent oxidoreductase n=1 Tax=Paenibacillus sp. S-38 TaxID=3416710 RepID=UPI003CFBABEB
MYDAAIIGGGPAGLNAALMLGRARRTVVLLDDNKARNAVSRESHGFLTRDGIRPSDLRLLAQQELKKYASVTGAPDRVIQVERSGPGFKVVTEDGFTVMSRTLVLATGFKEVLPEIPGIREFYGQSLFNCPYCDGWELRDKGLVLVSDGLHLFQMAKLLVQWSRDLLVCTNGWNGMTPEQARALAARGIQIHFGRIAGLEGEEGQLKELKFTDGSSVLREGGFVKTQWVQGAPFGYRLGCRINAHGGLLTDSTGRTTVPGVFAAGDAAVSGPTLQIIAAAEGSRAAMGVNQYLTDLDFGW